MSNEAKIYWLTRLDHINEITSIVGMLGLIGLILYAIFYMIVSDNDYADGREIKEYKRQFGVCKSIALYMIFLFATIKLFVPTQKEAILIVAGGATMDYVQADSTLQKIPSQASDLFSKYMDQKIKELEDKK